MDNFVYLVGSPQGKTCAVVDPAWNVPAILQAAAADGRRITHALVSHCHADHINGLEDLIKATGAQVVAQREEIEFSKTLRGFGKDLAPSSPGYELDLEGLTIRCIHTPGHTPGSQCLQIPEGLLTGDTLFIGACGRCDLEGGDPEQMFESLSTLRKLEAETVIYPGHDYGETPTDTLAHQRELNPYLKLAERDAFAAYRNRPR
jgi:hydroxyacylglutathione hydrolase